MTGKASKIRILYMYKHNRSFVEGDLSMLQRHFDVVPSYFNIRNLFFLPFLVCKSDVTFIWFASYHAFISTIFSKLFSKKVIVVTGGYDVACEKEINYGLLRNPLLKRMVKFVLKNADKILAVSEFNKREIQKYLGMNNAEVIYNGIDSGKLYPQGNKEILVITVGFISWENIKRKGLETFTKAAKYLPDTKFVVIGKAIDDSVNYLESIASGNVKFAGFVPNGELLKYYQKAKVYCQLSYYESFGMALAEAMLCECVPVVTGRGALPEVVGDTGFYAKYGDEKITADAIKKALNSQKGGKAKERIKENFSCGIREEKLVRLIEEI